MATGPQTTTMPGDPLIAAIARLAEHFGVPFALGMPSGLALDDQGRLPLHQLEPALEVLGLNCFPGQSKRLPRRASSYPAVIALADGSIAVIHELNGKDALTWRPGSADNHWEALATLERELLEPRLQRSVVDAGGTAVD